MSYKDTRLIANIYRIGQVMSSSPLLTTYTAYHRYSNDVVGLFVIELPPSLPVAAVQQLLQPLSQRRLIQSPHVLYVYDAGTDGPRAYIATDPPRGVTLRYVLDTDNIDLKRSLDIIQQLTRGVQAFHEQQIFGLDLRPRMITIDTLGIVDRAQIDDIGLRTLLLQLGYLQNQQSNEYVFLDPRYAPPEYIHHGRSGPWSDIYQLGLLFFELITGRPPFVGQNPAETGILQSTEPVPRMSQYNHEVPASFQALVEHALQKEPQKRYATASDLLADLAQLQLPARQTGQQPTTQQTGVDLTAEIPEVPTDSISPSVASSTPIHTADVQAASMQSMEVYAYLCFEQDGSLVRRFALTKEVSVIGRLDPKRNVSPDIDLTEIDPKMTISRQHARIRFEKTFFYIEDLKSSNKTRLGELTLLPLKPELLQHGDTISVGSVRLKFEVPGMNQPYIFQDRK